MAFLSYWTIPYVSIHDTRLIYLYNVGFVCVLASLGANVFLHQTYLESDRLQGITQARIKTPKGWEPRIEDPFCKENLCVKWDADEVGYAYTSDSIFVTTKIKDDLEKSTCDAESQNKFRDLGNDNITEKDDGDYDSDSEDDKSENYEEIKENEEDTKENAKDDNDDMVLECAEYKRTSKKYYYPYGIEDFYLKINAFAEAQEFCSQLKHVGDILDAAESESDCPYVYAMNKIPGELKSFNGTVLAHFNKDDEISSPLKEIPISTFLEAAGANFLKNKKMRDKGGVLMITVKFHLDFDRMGFLTGLLSNPRTNDLPTKFTVYVSKLAKAGYRMREVVGHTKNERRVRTYYGLHFKLTVAGKAKRFSWAKLVSEIVMKFGLFGVMSTILDLLWQIVFPMVGFPDYNDLVYREVKLKNENQERLEEWKEDKNTTKMDETEDYVKVSHNLELKLNKQESS